MPAKTKYLSSSGQRWLKVSAAILGGYLVTMTIQMAFTVQFEDKGPALMTSALLAFFLWVFFMIIPFTFHNGWKVWGLYMLIIALSSLVIYLS